ncbi:MAG: MraY family glycosyltransferase [Atopobium sp.]|uniref:glycosyltransferase family 4 protein n=1 Tax=Atopobium sp. TaxID=1872650 RepID=UPI002A80BB27|nr:MraY family glycosyltransferase [Atopobium sp.]MDY4522367.1 MraY family glycosyltransferase [Atopobium sp.]
MSSYIPYMCVYLVALIATVITTPLAKLIARKVGSIDKPGKRRINKTPIPRMGGIAVFIGLVAAAVTQYIGTTRYLWPIVLVPHPGMSVNYYLLAASLTCIFFVGVLDDIFSLKPLVKFTGQIIAAVIAVCGGLVIGNIYNPLTESEIVLGFLTYPITIMYLVAYCNIINLIDGLDGLASGITCIASLTMFVLATAAGRLDAAALSIALAGTTLGFLRFNFNPASIFLGDSGSLLLGFTLGAISLLNVTRVAGLTTIIIPLLVASIPIIDTLSAIVRRKRAHVSIGQADKGHIHHRLIQSGFDQRQAVLLIYAWTAMLCIGSFVMTKVPVWPRMIIFIVLIVASGSFASKLHLFEPVLLHHYDPEADDDVLITPDNPAFEQEAKAQKLEGSTLRKRLKKRKNKHS